jgi:hypothetical protein
MRFAVKGEERKAESPGAGVSGKVQINPAGARVNG